MVASGYIPPAETAAENSKRGVRAAPGKTREHSKDEVSDESSRKASFANRSVAGGSGNVRPVQTGAKDKAALSHNSTKESAFKRPSFGGRVGAAAEVTHVAMEPAETENEERKKASFAGGEVIVELTQEDINGELRSYSPAAHQKPALAGGKVALTSSAEGIQTAAVEKAAKPSAQQRARRRHGTERYDPQIEMRSSPAAEKPPRISRTIDEGPEIVRVQTEAVPLAHKSDEIKRPTSMERKKIAEGPKVNRKLAVAAARKKYANRGGSKESHDRGRSGSRSNSAHNKAARGETDGADGVEGSGEIPARTSLTHKRTSAESRGNAKVKLSSSGKKNGPTTARKATNTHGIERGSSSDQKKNKKTISTATRAAADERTTKTRHGGPSSARGNTSSPGKPIEVKTRFSLSEDNGETQRSSSGHKSPSKVRRAATKEISEEKKQQRSASTHKKSAGGISLAEEARRVLYEAGKAFASQTSKKAYCPEAAANKTREVDESSGRKPPLSGKSYAKEKSSSSVRKADAGRNHKHEIRSYVEQEPASISDTPGKVSCFEEKIGRKDAAIEESCSNMARPSPSTFHKPSFSGKILTDEDPCTHHYSVFSTRLAVRSGHDIPSQSPAPKKPMPLSRTVVSNHNKETPPSKRDRTDSTTEPQFNRTVAVGTSPTGKDVGCEMPSPSAGFKKPSFARRVVEDGENKCDSESQTSPGMRLRPKFCAKMHVLGKPPFSAKKVAQSDMTNPIRVRKTSPTKKTSFRSLPKLAITDIVNAQVLNSDNPEAWLLQGPMEKYRPGFAQNYYPKWCTVSRSAFSYYRNKWAANCFMEAPMLSIPISCIKSVRRVPVAVPEEQKKRRARNGNPDPYNFQFEILVREHLHFVSSSLKLDGARETMAVASAGNKGNVVPIAVKQEDPAKTHVREVTFRMSIIVGTPDEAASTSPAAGGRSR